MLSTRDSKRYNVEKCAASEKRNGGEGGREGGRGAYPIAHDDIVLGNNFESKNRRELSVRLVQRVEKFRGRYSGFQEFWSQEPNEEHSAG